MKNWKVNKSGRKKKKREKQTNFNTSECAQPFSSKIIADDVMSAYRHVEHFDSRKRPRAASALRSELSAKSRVQGSKPGIKQKDKNIIRRNSTADCVVVILGTRIWRWEEERGGGGGLNQKLIHIYIHLSLSLPLSHSHTRLQNNYNVINTAALVAAPLRTPVRIPPIEANSTAPPLREIIYSQIRVWVWDLWLNTIRGKEARKIEICPDDVSHTSTWSRMQRRAIIYLQCILRVPTCVYSCSCTHPVAHTDESCTAPPCSNIIYE